MCLACFRYVSNYIATFFAHVRFVLETYASALIVNAKTNPGFKILEVFIFMFTYLRSTYSDRLFTFVFESYVNEYVNACAR